MAPSGEFRIVCRRKQSHETTTPPGPRHGLSLVVDIPAAVAAKTTMLGGRVPSAGLHIPEKSMIRILGPGDFEPPDDNARLRFRDSNDSDIDDKADRDYARSIELCTPRAGEKWCEADFMYG